MALAPSTPLSAAVFERQRELEEALASSEAAVDERARLLSRAKAALETLHAELLRARADAAAYQAEVRAVRRGVTRQ